MEQLREDIICSICLQVLNNPVSIECGHNFCRDCLVAHQSRAFAWRHCCPECRASCSRGRMIPDTRIKNLVEKIAEQLQEETELGPDVQLEPGRPVQLVRLDEEGGLSLDEKTLSCWLEQDGVGNAPVCLVSIIGEQRWGKSFLMNYLLRRLRSQQDASEGSWMGQEDEPLEGFEWRMDEEQVTKGVWAWSQPFWIPAEGDKVAVLLVDCEGSMDIGSNKETSIKLSAFSMLLSSYQILNIGRKVNDPDLEYLEMFLHVAEVVGKHYELEPIQHLDLLVRDWCCSLVLGDDGGKEHLRDIRQMLEGMSPCKHPRALEALKRSSTRCYLMPFPGRGIMTGSEGRLRDMDRDFQESLRVYISTLVGSASQHVQRDQHSNLLTGTQLAAKIKALSDVMKKHRFGFSSPFQMAITFHNERVMDRARTDHALFLKEKDGQSRHLIYCLMVWPSAVAKKFETKRRSLLERCQKDMEGSELERETLLTALKKELTEKAETFLETYRKRYKIHALRAASVVGGLVLGPLGVVRALGMGALASTTVEIGLTGAAVIAASTVVDTTAAHTERAESSAQQSDQEPLLRDFD
uniref:Uncharacterized protein n=1 Tax=Pelusios castaneus TaxID=367368 RepID=A0A8C8RP37_9SAUR